MHLDRPITDHPSDSANLPRARPSRQSTDHPPDSDDMPRPPLRKRPTNGYASELEKGVRNRARALRNMIGESNDEVCRVTRDAESARTTSPDIVGGPIDSYCSVRANVLIGTSPCCGGSRKPICRSQRMLLAI